MVLYHPTQHPLRMILRIRPHPSVRWPKCWCQREVGAPEVQGSSPNRRGWQSCSPFPSIGLVQPLIEVWPKIGVPTMGNSAFVGTCCPARFEIPSLRDLGQRNYVNDEEWRLCCVCLLNKYFHEGPSINDIMHWTCLNGSFAKAYSHYINEVGR